MLFRGMADLRVIRVKRRCSEEAVDSLFIDNPKRAKTEAKVYRLFETVSTESELPDKLAARNFKANISRNASTVAQKRTERVERKSEEQRRWRLKVIDEKRDSAAGVRILDAVIEEADEEELSIPLGKLDVSGEEVFDIYVEHCCPGDNSESVFGKWVNVTMEREFEDFVYENSESEPEPWGCEDEDSNDENHWRNDYPDECSESARDSSDYGDWY